LDFQLQKLVLALKMEIFGEDTPTGVYIDRLTMRYGVNIPHHSENSARKAKIEDYGWS